VWKAIAGRAGARLRPLYEQELADPVIALAWSGPGRLLLADYEGRIQARGLPSTPVP
jgi:hypothetical protein